MAPPDGGNASGVPAPESQPRGDGSRGRGRGRGKGGQNRRGPRRGRGGANDAPPATQAAQDVAAAAARGQSLAAGSATQPPDDDDDSEVCFICANPVTHHSIAPCNHTTCHICGLRMRALYKTKDCAHCRVCCFLTLAVGSSPCLQFLDSSSICHLHRRCREAVRGIHRQRHHHDGQQHWHKVHERRYCRRYRSPSPIQLPRCRLRFRRPWMARPASPRQVHPPQAHV